MPQKNPPKSYLPLQMCIEQAEVFSWALKYLRYMLNKSRKNKNNKNGEREQEEQSTDLC